MAGKSQRFYDAGYNIPKFLINIFGRSMIAHVLSVFKDVDDILVIVNESDYHNFNLGKILTDIRSDIKIAVIAPHSFGPSYSILKASKEVNKSKKIIVHYCDFSGNWELSDVVYALDYYDGVYVGFEGFQPNRSLNATKFAYAKVNETNQLSEIKEKGSFTSNPELELASSGIYGFASGDILIKAIEAQFQSKLDINGEYYTSLTQSIMLKNSMKIYAISMKCFFGWGTPEDLEDYIYFSSIFKSLNQETYQTGLITHKVIILSGGQSSRLKIAGEIPKQLKIIKNDSNLLDLSVGLNSNISNVYMVAVENVYSAVKNYWNIPLNNLKILSHSSESQLATVQLGLELIQPKDCIVTFLASDNIVLLDELIAEIFLDSDITVWCASKYPVSRTNPNQYSWIKVSDENNVEETMYKSAPDGIWNWKIMTGNFTFKNSRILIELIDNYKAEIGIRNHEPMLDDFIEFDLRSGLKIKAFDVGNFFTLGTKLENNLYDYFMANLDFVSR